MLQLLISESGAIGLIQITYLVSDELCIPGRFLAYPVPSKYWDLVYTDHEIFHLVGISPGVYDHRSHYLLVL